MAGQVNRRETLRFGVFEADLDSGQLFRRGASVRIQDKPFQILGMLLRRPGEIVTRDELKSKLWPKGTFVDFDEGLNTGLKKLRQALGDSADAPIFIETVPRRGYRFIAPVTGNELMTAEAVSRERALAQAVASNGEIAVDDAGTSAATQRMVRARSSFALSHRKTLLVIAVLVGAAAISFAVHRWAARRGASDLPYIQVTKLMGDVMASGVAVSPDGKFIAYARRDGEKEGLRIRQIGTQADKEILPLDTRGFHGITFSPDGKFIYFVRSDKKEPFFKYLYVMPTLGGIVRQLITDVDSPVSFSPDGKQFVYEHCAQPQNDIELKIANADGSKDHILAVIHDGNGFMFQPGPSWSPDGQTIVLPVRLLGKQRLWALEAVSTSTGKVKELYSSDEAVGRPAWTSDGHSLLLSHRDPALHRSQLWNISFPEGKARAFTHDLLDYGDDLDMPGDKRSAVAIASKTVSSAWASSATNLAQAERLTSDEISVTHIIETADGKLLMTGGDGVLWIMNTDGSQLSRFGEAHNIDEVTACGRFLVYTTREHGRISLMRANNAWKEATRLANGNLCCATCLPDGKVVYYASFEQPQKIWRVPVWGGPPSEVMEVQGSQLTSGLSVSPDGKLLAYSYTRYGHVPPEGRKGVVVPIEGGPPLTEFNTPGEIAEPRWSPDGKSLQYVLVKAGTSNIWEQRVAGGQPKQLTKFISGQIFDFSWSRDGKKLLLTRGKISTDAVLLSNLR